MIRFELSIEELYQDLLCHFCYLARQDGTGKRRNEGSSGY